MVRSISSRRCLWSLLGVGILAIYAPAARAQDAVETLKRTLKESRWEQVAKDTQRLKTLSDLRRAYFLSEWREPGDNPEQIKALAKLRQEVGDKLAQRIRAAALGDEDRQIAACILIAEMADTDPTDQRSPTGKYASRFANLLLGTKQSQGLVHSEDVRVRQAALHALGKITPFPGEAMPVLRSVLKSDELGPRRLAAYALTDLVKNAAFLGHGDEMATINQAVAEAGRVLDNPNQDEQIRGYCLQTILISARIFTDYRWANKFDPLLEPGPVQFELDKKLNKLVLDPRLQELLKSYRSAMPRVISSLESDPSANIRLTALETISQLITSRYQLCEKLQTKYGKEVLPRSGLLKAFNVPDPIEPLLAGQWVVIPGVVRQSADVRLRRGAMLLLERVAEDVEAAQEAKKAEKQITPATIKEFVRAITPALSDPDRFVRWTAARTLRYVSPDYLDDEVIIALGRMLIDPQTRDPDLSAAAATTIEAVANAPYATRAILFLRSAIADPTMDADNRIAAMKALVAIGAKAANQAAANEAFAELTTAVGSDDASVRREACLTLGQLGHPDTEEAFSAAIAALKLAMRDEDTEVRLNASEAILSITPPP